MTSIGVIFGGRSVEHEVSVLTAHQAMAALDDTDFSIVPVYIGKDGQWYTGTALRELSAFADIASLMRRLQMVRMSFGEGRLVLEPRAHGLRRFGAGSLAIDVALPLVHGTFGEDGTLQGLLEMANVPYIGCDVAASAIGMDKHLTKVVLGAAGVPVLPYLMVWQKDPGLAQIAERISSGFGFPVYVKPRNLGSSIGVSRVASADELGDAIELALSYTDGALIEPSQEGAIEINCSVMRKDGAPVASVCEQLTKRGLVSYVDKYMGGAKQPARESKSTQAPAAKGGMKNAGRIVPAPLGAATTRRVQEMSMAAYSAIRADGIVRVDLLMDEASGKLTVNELNTIPGSLAFYLWSETGLSFPRLLETAVTDSRRRFFARDEHSYSIDSWLLSGAPPVSGK